MINKPVKKPRSLFAMLLVITCLGSVSCARKSTPPAPSIAAGVYIKAGYEYFDWEEGLALMIWHDAVQSSMCDSSGSTRDSTHVVQCSAVSRESQSFEWQIKTSDGIQAEFSIDGSLFDLANGNVFLVAVEGESTDIQQLHRDLTDVDSQNANTITGFGLNDPDINSFIQSLTSK